MGELQREREARQCSPRRSGRSAMSAGCLRRALSRRSRVIQREVERPPSFESRRAGAAARDATRRPADAARSMRGVAQRSDELLEIFTVDLDEIAEFTATYELHDPFSILCFWRGRVPRSHRLWPRAEDHGAGRAARAPRRRPRRSGALGPRRAPPPAERVVGGTTWLTGLMPGLSEGLADAQSSARAGLHTITQRLGEYGLM